MSETKQKAPPISVNMTDGRVVEFGAKARLKKESRADETNVYVTLDFVNGETRTFKTPHFLAVDALGTEHGKLMLKAACHGLEQKLGDEISGVEELDDAIEAIDQLIVRLEKGYSGWTQRSEGSSMAGASILARAVAEALGQPLEVVREALSNMSAKERAALKLDENIAPIVKRLEDEKAAKAAAAGKNKPAIDTKSLLARVGQKPVTSAFDNGQAGGQEAPM